MPVLALSAYQRQRGRSRSDRIRQSATQSDGCRSPPLLTRGRSVAVDADVQVVSDQAAVGRALLDRHRRQLSPCPRGRRLASSPPHRSRLRWIDDGVVCRRTGAVFDWCSSIGR